MHAQRHVFAHDADLVLARGEERAELGVRHPTEGALEVDEVDDGDLAVGRLGELAGDHVGDRRLHEEREAQGYRDREAEGGAGEGAEGACGRRIPPREDAMEREPEEDQGARVRRHAIRAELAELRLHCEEEAGDERRDRGRRHETNARELAAQHRQERDREKPEEPPRRRR